MSEIKQEIRVCLLQEEKNLLLADIVLFEDDTCHIESCTTVIDGTTEMHNTFRIALDKYERENKSPTYSGGYEKVHKFYTDH